MQKADNETDVTLKERAVEKVAPKACHGIPYMQPLRQNFSDVTLPPLSLIYILTMQEARSGMDIRMKIIAESGPPSSSSINHKPSLDPHNQYSTISTSRRFFVYLQASD